jgi:hypothetical protein
VLSDFKTANGLKGHSTRSSLRIFSSILSFRQWVASAGATKLNESFVGSYNCIHKSTYDPARFSNSARLSISAAAASPSMQ